ncbi:MAG: SDR family oxidoreductase [Planctomycetaceae bacterium]
MSEKRPAEYLRSLFGLEGRTAVVIGGTGVLGSTIAETLAAAGAYVWVVGLNEVNGQSVVDRITRAGGAARFHSANATQQADLETLRDNIAAEGKTCDILVNGAGVNSATPFVEITEEEWQRIFSVNLGSVRLACQVFGREMIGRETRGSIINIASLSAITPLSRVFTYSASKAAVLNLTQNLAREWAPHGIRVNALSPGFFPAEQNRKVLTPDRIDRILTHTPMNRFGESHELAGAVLLLASNQAGSFLTGANIVVDGGFSAMTI